MSEGARAHHFFLDITFHSLYTFNQLQQNTVAIHEKWKGRIDSWQPRRKPRRKRNTKREQQQKRGRGKRPLSFCARFLMRHHRMALQRHSEGREGSAVPAGCSLVADNRTGCRRVSSRYASSSAPATRASPVPDRGSGRNRSCNRSLASDRIDLRLRSPLLLQPSVLLRAIALRCES